MTKEETIQVLQSIEDRAVKFPNMTACDWVAIAAAKRHLENSLEVKEVNFRKEFNKYFYNFTNPKTGEKLKKEECWLDIKQAQKFGKHFFELGLKAQKWDFKKAMEE